MLTYQLSLAWLLLDYASPVYRFTGDAFLLGCVTRFGTNPSALQIHTDPDLSAAAAHRKINTAVICRVRGGGPTSLSLSS